jgi:hypothetical protein
MSVISRLAPSSLQGYQRSWLPRDVVAGVTLAAVAIPETMGYTSIAQTLLSPACTPSSFPPSRSRCLARRGCWWWVQTRRPRRYLRPVLPARDCWAPAELCRMVGLDQPRGAGLRRAADLGEAAEAWLSGRLPERICARRVPHWCGYPGLHWTDPRHAGDGSCDRHAR